MRALITISIFLLVITSVSASHIFINRDELSEGDAEAYRTDNGIYTVELVMVSDGTNAAKFRVNNEMSDTLSIGESYEFKDGSVIIIRQILVIESGNDKVEYYFYGSGLDPIRVDMNVVRFDIEECNFDGVCQENETKEDCCYDCGCKAMYKCEDNRCTKKEGCISDEECDDEKACTQDSCSNGKCSYRKLTGCEFEDKCSEYGSIKKIDAILSYCSENMWNRQKEKNQDCKKEYECLSGKCDDDKCYERSFTGLFRSLILILVLTGIYFSIKKFQIIKKIKRYLFWK